MLLNALMNESDKIRQPNNISIELKEHQKTAVHAMNKLESDGNIAIENTIIETNIGILGDIVGSGKTLMVIALINHNIVPIKHNIIQSGSPFICLKENSANSVSIKTNLIIVPHNLVFQWSDFFKISKLRTIEITKKKDLMIGNIADFDVVICSSTQYKNLMDTFNNIRWSRIIIDEADNIKLPQNINWKCNFIWFITGTPMGLKYLYKNYFKFIFENMEENIFLSIIVKNDDKFVKDSLQLPTINRFYIKCDTPKDIDLIKAVIPSNILQMLNAGNIKEAITRLNCHVDIDTNILQVVTKNLQTEIYNKELEVNYQKNIIVANILGHNKHISQLQNELIQLKNRYESIKNKLYDLYDDICGICIDKFKSPILVNCCNNLFCLECILKSLDVKNTCPYCRKKISNKNIHVIDNDRIYVEKAVENKKYKIDHLMEILQRDRKYLIFSNYAETFNKIKIELDKQNYTHNMINGNNDKICKIIKDFNDGTINILMLNAQFYGSGLNLQEADDIIIFHKLDEELEKQVIGRAHRLGRTKPLNVHYLLHENEMD